MRTDNEQDRQKALGMLLLLLLAMLLVGLSSCATPKVVHDTQYITKHDSIYITRVDKELVHDSVYIKDKGDTLFVYKYRYIDRYKVDTIIENHTDTIYKIVTETKTEYIEKPLTWWQQTRLTLSNILFGVVGLCLLALGVKYRANITHALQVAVRWLVRVFKI